MVFVLNVGHNCLAPCFFRLLYSAKGTRSNHSQCYSQTAFAQCFRLKIDLPTRPKSSQYTGTHAVDTNICQIVSYMILAFA